MTSMAGFFGNLPGSCALFAFVTSHVPRQLSLQYVKYGTSYCKHVMGGSTNSLSHASHLLPPVFDARTICAHAFQSNTFGSSAVGAAPSLSSSTVWFRLCLLPPLSRMSDTLAHFSARSVSES